MENKKESRKSYSALDIAGKVLKRAAAIPDTDSGELISNMKLQKLLYYLQGFHLAYFGKPLFEEEIEAWMYGPAVPSVYEHFKGYRNKGIEYTDDVISLSEEEEALFDEVYRIYGVYSAIGLMEMTHKETPWRTTPTGTGNAISKKVLASFFKKRLK
ncbi:putative phage-associated protein [Bacteroidales bacterium Barb7]|nr:putative phage-associated protein [Bacteroidales bacterium Barb7]